MSDEKTVPETKREKDLRLLLEQADAKTRSLAAENRKLVDQVGRLSAELRRATKLLADVAMRGTEDSSEEAAESPLNGHAAAE